MRGAISIAAVGLLAACANSTVPDLNSGSVSGFQQSPTGAAAGAIALGMVRGARDNTANMVWNVGAFGREGYQMGVAQGDLTLYVDGPITSNTFYLDLLWDQQYSDIRAGNTVLDAMSRIPDLTSQQLSAMAGFIQTMMAYDLIQLAATRDTFGLPIAVDVTPGGPAAPIADKATVYQHIVNLLDSGQTNLQAGGAAFSFALPPGFAGFNTPATFLQVNRGLRARADILTKNWANALTDLNASFVSTAQPLAFGPFFDYSANSGDETNILFKPYYYVANWIISAAQLQANGTTLDNRVLTKTVQVAPFLLDSIAASYQFTAYNSVSAPLPMLRNEELILLRAEANIGLGNGAAALTDINFIRATSVISRRTAPVQRSANRPSSSMSCFTRSAIRSSGSPAVTGSACASTPTQWVARSSPSSPRSPSSTTWSTSSRSFRIPSTTAQHARRSRKVAPRWSDSEAISTIEVALANRG